MQTIPTSYKQAGHAMRLVKREGNAAMYADVAKTYWEVHLVRVQQANEVMGRHYPDREVLASSGQFGQRAWACTSQERAEARFLNALSLECGDSEAQTGSE